MIVHACSTNSGKLRELTLATEETRCPDLRLELLPGLDHISAPEETGLSFEENAAIKALHYSAFSSEIVLADDSGLEVEALNGAPGVHSARFAGPGSTDADNNELLLRRLHNSEERSAQFVCVIALARAGRILMTARGTVKGEILHAVRGEHGFGYDPLFYYAPFGCSFGEVDRERKFAVSHRGQALRKVVDWLCRCND
jgi:XTP/dITP diphosphohydrolase